MKLKWLVFSIVLIVVVVGLILLGLSEQSAEAGQLVKVRQEAAKYGIPTSSADFAARVKKPSPTENAWPLYERAIRTIRPGALNGPESANPFGLDPEAIDRLLADVREWRRNQFESELSAESQATLQTVQPIFETLREASQKPAMYFEADWSKGIWLNMPELAEIGRLARLTIADALVAAEARDLKRFYDRLRIMTGFVRHLSSQPMLVYGFYAWNLAMSSLDVLQQELTQGRLSVAELPQCRDLAEALTPKVDPATVFGADIGASVISVDILSSREKIRKAGNEDRFASRLVPKPEARDETERILLESAIAILRRWPSDPEDTMAMKTALGVEDGAIPRALASYSSQFRIVLGDADQPPIGPMGRIVMAYQGYLTRKRLNRCLFRLLEDRQASGAFPAQLNSALGQDAIDPFTGKGFRYALRPGGFVLYSLGQNLKDDGGVDVRVNGRPIDIVIRFPGGGSSL